MADSGGTVKQFTDEMETAVRDVTRDVKDSVGQAIEQGVQSVAGTQLTPQQLQQKELERQKQLAETRRKLNWWNDLREDQRRVREQEKQKQLQRQQQEQQEKQKEEIVIIQKKKELPIAIKAMGKAELKRGVGG
ncbi:hypothetical protein HYT18_01785 [Candidatus Microgenomates bacterium]|nr:hypothetical protein [Candidatus Microgenomates bacterium]